MLLILVNKLSKILINTVSDINNSKGVDGTLWAYAGLPLDSESTSVEW